MNTNTWYLLLDSFFLLFHSTLVLFNLTGWMWKKARLPHLIVISLTIVSINGYSQQKAV
uniref:DUF2784 family protein n=1 Tax=Roseihalotalea indica TaxID=2867963 RepID=A0AA49GPC8_9BACT|nr:DUF2784 family protein [Tunicatimonas sp. TK19036]